MQGLQKLIGVIIGLSFGAAWIQWGFGSAVLVAFVGLIGYLVGAFFAGEIDVIQLLARRNR